MWALYLYPCLHDRHHAWVSFEAIAESYNEVNNVTNNNNLLKLKQFLQKNPLTLKVKEGEQV